ncbi:MAG: DUF2203 family protein [Acidobacteria bacterium]|nr:DUF2203 family protein [Acidobacteriota bacterium]
MELLACAAMALSPRRRTFSYQEALASFPAVRALTSRAVRRIEALVNRLQSREEMENRKKELQQACQEIVDEWTEEVNLLGCEVKGLWLVDWDCGVGYYCWKYPEESLAHFHGYEEGFDGRVPIQ